MRILFLTDGAHCGCGVEDVVSVFTVCISYLVSRTKRIQSVVELRHVCKELHRYASHDQSDTFASYHRNGLMLPNATTTKSATDGVAGLISLKVTTK